MIAHTHPKASRSGRTNLPKSALRQGL